MADDTKNLWTSCETAQNDWKRKRIEALGSTPVVSQEAAPGVDGRTWQSYKQNLTPLAFCATSGYLVYSSLAYTGVGELVGLLVLAACTLGLAPTRGGS
jgi:hypothetical protein